METQHVAGQLYYGTMIKPEFMVALFENKLDERELKLLVNSMDYANGDFQAGLPGHNLMVLIGKLMDIMQVEKDIVLQAITNTEDVELDECFECACNCNCNLVEDEYDFVKELLKAFEGVYES